MTATNENAYVIEIAPLGGATLNGYKLGWLPVTSGFKVLQNDTITIKNAKAVDTAFLQVDSTGAAESNTVSTNVITLTSTTTGSAAFRGLIIYR